jgi:hypothetical protein
MSMTPIHPNLLLDRRMTKDEMLEALEFEGMFKIGWRDLPVAIRLKAENKIILEYWDRNRGWHGGWHVCLL